MNGILLAGVGVWVLCQILGGNALQRLNIITDSGGGSGSFGEGLGQAAGGAASDIGAALAGRIPTPQARPV